MAVKAEKLELVGITSLHNGVASNGVESKLADNGTHNASNGAWNRRRSTTEEGVQASMSPLLEEIHSDLMLRHILASSEDGETGGSFHYSGALRAQLDGRLRTLGTEPPANGAETASAGPARNENGRAGVVHDSVAFDDGIAGKSEEGPDAVARGSGDDEDETVLEQLEKRHELRRQSSARDSEHRMRYIGTRQTFTAAYMDRFHVLVMHPESSIAAEQVWHERTLVFDRIGEVLCMHHPSNDSIAAMDGVQRSAAGRGQTQVNRKTKVYSLHGITSWARNDFNYAQMTVSTNIIKLCLNQFGEKVVVKKGERADIRFDTPAEREKFLSVFIPNIKNAQDAAEV
jgi:hypothetical protein